MSQEQTLEHDATSVYAQHLAAVNETQRVRASSDVVSVHGVLIARKGAAIDYETARKIVRHKLTMPLDKNVELDHVISATGLHRRFGAMLEKHSDVRLAHQNLQCDALFERAATKLDLPRLVAQKLTVMAIRQPTLMDQTLLGAWLACLIGQQLGLEENELALIYMAAVSRDLGMLHIEPSLLEKPQVHEYTSDEWRALQSHAVASHMILKECEVIPERVLDAVIQHHENVDGTGYPSNLRGAELGLMGQILSCADTLVALRVKWFVGSGRNLRDALAALGVEADAYRHEVYSAAVQVLTRSGVSRTTFHAYETRADLVAALTRRARLIMSIQGLLADMPNLIPIENKKLAPLVLTAHTHRLSQVLARSGIADGETSRLVGLVAEGKEEIALADLTELDLQQREVLWQFRRLQSNLHAFAEQQKMRSRSPIRLIIERMSAFVEQMESDPDLLGLPPEKASGPTGDLAYGEDFLGGSSGQDVA